MVLDSVNIVASSFAEAEAVISQGYGNRATEGTLCNVRSSRSHVLLILEIEKGEPEDNCMGGRLVLVDLAGSENIQKSGADEGGKRLAEAQFINKSLSCLSDVVHATATQQSFVPYRNSRLTMLLEESLTNAKVLLLVHVSPLQADATCTAHSLQFASRVRAVDFGVQRRAQDQVDSAKAAQLRSAQETRHLQLQLDNTKKELENSRKEKEKENEHLRKELKDSQHEVKQLKQQVVQLQDQLRGRDRGVRTPSKSAENSHEQENQTSRPQSPYPSRPRRQTPLHQRPVPMTPKRSPIQDSAERAPCGDLTNYNAQTSDQKIQEDPKADAQTLTPMRLTPQDEIVTPKHVPVIPLSPQAAVVLDGVDHGAALQSTRTEHVTGTGRYNRYDGKTVKSILRR